MICKNCRKAKPHAPGSMYCILYGIIISEKHEGNLKGCEWDIGPVNFRRENESGAEIQGDGSGTAGGMPEVLPGDGERTGVYGMEEEWPE